MMLFFPNANGQDHILNSIHSLCHNDISLDLDLENINSASEQVDQIVSKNDFEALVNFDGGADF